MTGATPLMLLATAQDSDSQSAYLTQALANSLRRLDSHNHSGGLNGGQLPSNAIAGDLTVPGVIQVGSATITGAQVQKAVLGATTAITSPGPGSTVLCSLTLGPIGTYHLEGCVLFIAPASGSGSTACFQISDDSVGISLRGGQISSNPSVAAGYRYSMFCSVYRTTTVTNTVVALRAAGQIAGWSAIAYEDVYFGANAGATYLTALRVG